MPGSTSIRWAAGVGVALLLQSIVVSGLLWVGTAQYKTRSIRHSLEQDCTTLSQRTASSVLDAVNDRMNGDLHRTGYVGLFAASGHKVLGNLLSLPELPSGNRARRITITAGADARSGLGSGARATNAIMATRCRLANGDTLILGEDLDELDALRNLVLRAILGASLPAVLVALCGGLLLSDRAQRQLQQVEAVMQRVMAGHLHERLPVMRGRDRFSRLCASVNTMLDRIETLMAEVRGVGDDVAHQLRTPLTRLRASLERMANGIPDAASLHDVAERAIRETDQALDVISAMLRIREIEFSARVSAFRMLSLSTLVQDAVDLYAATAEERGITLEYVRHADPRVLGDPDLLMEAVSNLVDNAIKFSPAGGSVVVCLSQDSQGLVRLSVADRGPGLSGFDRDRVVQRFYRAAWTSRTPGAGLGLSLVDAIVTLHGFALAFENNEPGCVAIILFGRISQTTGQDATPPVAAGKAARLALSDGAALLGRPEGDMAV